MSFASNRQKTCIKQVVNMVAWLKVSSFYFLTFCTIMIKVKQINIKLKVKKIVKKPINIYLVHNIYTSNEVKILRCHGHLPQQLQHHPRSLQSQTRRCPRFLESPKWSRLGHCCPPPSTTHVPGSADAVRKQRYIKVYDSPGFQL